MRSQKRARRIRGEKSPLVPPCRNTHCDSVLCVTLTLQSVAVITPWPQLWILILSRLWALTNMILHASITLRRWVDQTLLKQSTSTGHFSYFQFLFHKWQLDFHLWALSSSLISDYFSGLDSQKWNYWVKRYEHFKGSWYGLPNFFPKGLYPFILPKALHAFHLLSSLTSLEFGCTNLCSLYRLMY